MTVLDDGLTFACVGCASGLREVCEAHSHSLQESDGVQEGGESAVSEACQSSIAELESDGTAAAHKLVEALRHLVYVVLVTSIPS